MQSVGEMLRLERLRQGRDLEEAAVKTRINPKFLEAIEADDTASLPGDFFYRSFVRQYGTYLGVDEGELDAALAEVVPKPEPRTAGPPIVVPPVDTGWRDQGMYGRRFPAASVGLLIIVVLACSAVYSIWQRSRDSRTASPAVSAPPAAKPPAPPPPAVSPVAQPAGVSAPSPEPAAGPPPRNAAPAEAPSPVLGTGPLKLEITAKADAWVQVDVDGKKVTTRILKPGESRAFAASQAISLLTGNAGGVELKVNGRDVGAPGPAGQIRRVAVTQQGYEIRNPRQAAEDAP